MSKHFEMLPEEAFQKIGKTMKLYKKGGGGGGNSTVNQTNIPDYARGYVENMLGAAQQQLFNTTTDAKGNISIDSFRDFVPYSENPEDYVAGFSDLQNTARDSAAGLSTPGQFNTATNMSTAAGNTALDAAGNATLLAGLGTDVGMGALNYGASGAGYGAEAGNAGAEYEAKATNPNAYKAYMNPYLESSLAPQIEAMRRQYGITGTEQQGRATAAGAFGGSREALMASENERAKNSAIDNAIAQGYKTAFDNAQSGIQFGSNLGLKGKETAIQGANTGISGANAGISGVNTALTGVNTGIAGVGTAITGANAANTAGATLADTGTKELAADTSIIDTQNKLGAEDRAYDQAVIDQAISTYANEQQAPMQALANMSGLLRGLPLEQTTTDTYSAGPGALQTAAAIGTGIAGAGKGVAKGGVIKSYASGGIVGYAGGGDVMSEENARGIAQDLTADQMQQVQPRTLPDYIRIPLLNQKIEEQKAADQAMAAQQGQAQQEPLKQQVLAQAGQLGIDAAQSNLPDEAMMAGGGIVSFATGGVNAPNFPYTHTDLNYGYLDELAKSNYNPATGLPYTFEEKVAENRAREKAANIKDITDDELKILKDKETKLKDREDRATGRGLLAASRAIASAKPGESWAGLGFGAYGETKGAEIDKIAAIQENYDQQSSLLRSKQMEQRRAALAGDTAGFDKLEKDIQAIKAKKGEGANANITAKKAAELEAAKAQFGYREKMDEQQLQNQGTLAAAQAGAKAYAPDVHLATAINNKISYIQTEKTKLEASIKGLQEAQNNPTAPASKPILDRYKLALKYIYDSASSLDEPISSLYRAQGKSDAWIKKELDRVNNQALTTPSETSNNPAPGVIQYNADGTRKR